MTKKDYELIATPIHITMEQLYRMRAIYEMDDSLGLGQNNDGAGRRAENEASIGTIAQLVGWLEYQLSKSDPKFNRDKFRISCGFVNN